MNKRVSYFDTYRFIAAMMIFLTHYISSFSKASFKYFHMMPYSIVLEAVRGSLGVQILCVILGYFAYKKGSNSKESLLSLSLKRYIYFVVVTVVYYLIAFASGRLSIGGGALNTALVLGRASITLSDEYNGLFWTLIPMLIGSILCYIMGKGQMQTGGLIVAAFALLLMKDPQVFCCVLGCFVAVWQDNKTVERIMSRWYLQLLAIVISFHFIKADHESFRLFILQGVFCVVLLMVTMNNTKIEKIMGAHFWTKFNRSYFSLYVFHMLLFRSIGKKMLYMDGAMPFKYRFVLVFLLLTLIIILLSKPLDIVVNFVARHLYRVVDKTEMHIKKYISILESHIE